MPSENSVSLANLQRKNLPHIASALNMLEPMPLLNGLFRFQHKEQAYNLPVSHRYHQIQPVTTVAPSAFTNTNYFFDFNLPMNIDILDDEVLVFTLQNNDPTNNWAPSASVPFWYQRVEIRVDNTIIQTLRDIDLYMENTIYLDDFERGKNHPMIALSPSTYQVDASGATIAPTKNMTFRLRLNSLLSKCTPFIKAIKGQIIIRVYPQAMATFSSSASNPSMVLQNPILLIRELELTQDGRNKMMTVYRENVDFRFLQVVDEQAVVNLNAGSTYKYVTNNFHNTVYSHVVVLTRYANPTLANLETFIQHNVIYFEDAGSTNLSNGIQWLSDDLKQIVYQEHFPNSMTQQTNMNVYVPLLASSDPVKANKKGVENGWEVLPTNSKVCINSTYSGQVQLDIIAYQYTHVRIENGTIKVY